MELPRLESRYFRISHNNLRSFESLTQPHQDSEYITALEAGLLAIFFFSFPISFLIFSLALLHHRRRRRLDVSREMYVISHCVVRLYTQHIMHVMRLRGAIEQRISSSFRHSTPFDVKMQSLLLQLLLTCTFHFSFFLLAPSRALLHHSGEKLAVGSRVARPLALVQFHVVPPQTTRVVCECIWMERQQWEELFHFLCWFISVLGSFLTTKKCITTSTTSRSVSDDMTMRLSVFSFLYTACMESRSYSSVEIESDNQHTHQKWNGILSIFFKHFPEHWQNGFQGTALDHWQERSFQHLHANMKNFHLKVASLIFRDFDDPKWSSESIDFLELCKTASTEQWNELWINRSEFMFSVFLSVAIHGKHRKSSAESLSSSGSLGNSNIKWFIVCIHRKSVWLMRARVSSRLDLIGQQIISLIKSIHSRNSQSCRFCCR